MMKIAMMTAPLIMAATLAAIGMAAAQEPAGLVPPTQSPISNPAAAMNPQMPWPMSVPSIWVQDHGAREADLLKSTERRAERQSRPLPVPTTVTVPPR
jgi:hypothetical protein